MVMETSAVSLAEARGLSDSDLMLQLVSGILGK